MSEKKLSFEEAYAALEQIAEKLNSGDTSLEEALKFYEEGIKLSAQCSSALENAKQQIEALKKGDSE